MSNFGTAIIIHPPPNPLHSQTNPRVQICNPLLHLIRLSLILATMEMTPQELLQYNGTDPSKPIYLAVKGRVFDVTAGKSFYGPGGPYAMFAGKDASRALAKMSKNEEDMSPSLHGLSDKEIGVLNDWEKKFEAKYTVVGRLSS